MRLQFWVSLLALMLAACSDGSGDGKPDPADDGHDHDHDVIDAFPDAGPAAGDFDWQLPKGFPVPVVPEDNPMSAAKVELGRHLFYDVRLSDNQTFSCASCHKQELAFSDGKTKGVGSTGEVHPRNAMAIINVGYAATLTWANPLMTELERQSQAPIYGDAPIELGIRSPEQIEDRLRAVPGYEPLFEAAFPEQDEPITASNVQRAIASFQRVLISGRSPFDRYQYDGDEAALSDSAKRGFELFFGEKLECFHCHAGFDFSDHVNYAGKAQFEAPYHNTGLYNIDGKGSFPEPNTGAYEVTQDPDDMGGFKAPTLRNIAVTAPYMHDGSIATLSEVLDHYAAGGRTIASGPNAGVGSESPLKDSLIRGFSLSAQERADVIAFLESLTDTEFLTNPAFSDPGPLAP